MLFFPIDQLSNRVEIGKSESNTAFFNSLMYKGELICKLITLGLVATTDDCRDNHRYRLYYELVRADGIGDWVRIVDETLTGPAAQYIIEEAMDERRQLTEKKQGSWQHEAVMLMFSCLKVVDSDIQELPIKVDARKWFELFVRLRNKTRGHGAITGEQCNRIVEALEESIELVSTNYLLFQRSWAFLFKNRSGKYRVSKMTPLANEFEFLKSTTEIRIPDGVYVCYGNQLCRVDLCETNVDLQDFFVANGGFSSKKFELISYYSGKTIEMNSSGYLTPSTELPRSETRGLDKLDAIGNCLTNMPDQITGYIEREVLESELSRVLKDDRHPIVTLAGRGGIGKTSLALHVLNRITDENQYKLIIWLSARDIDLLEVGPKSVKPDVVTLREIVKEYWTHVDELALKEKPNKQIELFTKELNQLQEYGPIIFVFDNFETVSNPLEMYTFINTYIRIPNKVIITTRHREFKGDYPIDILGMSRKECDKLAIVTAQKNGMEGLITEEFLEELFHESDGHPYVVKIIIGEMSKPGAGKSINRIMANREDILEALFERTFVLLSEGARRVFFTLCNWRSLVPQIAIEAVLLRSSSINGRFDVKEAINELERVSFIEAIQSTIDNELFLNVPLAASIFGKKKLSISSMKNLIQADTEMLHLFGASQKHEFRNGIEPKIKRLFQNVSREISLKKTDLTENLPMLEFIARRHSFAWVHIANLIDTFTDDKNKVKLYLYKYLEQGLNITNESLKAWIRIAEIAEAQNDWKEYVHSLVEMSCINGVEIDRISDSANTINHMFVQGKLNYDHDEKFVLMRKLAETFKARINEGTATDCSRLCWLYLHLNEEEMAMEILKLGLEIEPNNEYCVKLKSKFITQGNWQDN